MRRGHCSNGLSESQNDVGLLAESYDPQEGRLRQLSAGLHPVGLVNSAYNLSQPPRARTKQKSASPPPGIRVMPLPTGDEVMKTRGRAALIITSDQLRRRGASGKERDKTDTDQQDEVAVCRSSRPSREKQRLARTIEPPPITPRTRSVRDDQVEHGRARIRAAMNTIQCAVAGRLSRDSHP